MDPQQIFDFVRDHASAVTHAVTGCASAAFTACALALKTRLTSWLKDRAYRRHRDKDERAFEGQKDKGRARAQAEFYMTTYRKLCCQPDETGDYVAIEDFHGRTVQQVCGQLGWALPDWADERACRFKMSKFA